MDWADERAIVNKRMESVASNFVIKA